MTAVLSAEVWVVVAAVRQLSLQLLSGEGPCRHPAATEQTCAYSTLLFLSVQVCWRALGLILTWL